MTLPTGSGGGGEYVRDMGDLVPRPDPTKLTTELVDRAIQQFGKLVETRQEVLETRLAGMDTATELVAKELEKITDDTGGQHRHMRDDFDRQLAALERHMTVLIQNVSNVSDERFKAIATQFAERDERSKQSDVERQKSLDAALAAAKEAVAAQQTANAASAAALQEANTVSIEKSETGFKERIDGLVLLMTTSNEAMGDKIVDLTKRLDRGEGHGAGQVEATAQRAETSRGNLMMASLVVAALAVIIPLTVVLISSR